MKKITLFILPLFVLLLACNKEDPVYYKATGEGYVYFKTTKTPASSINVIVQSYLIRSYGGYLNFDATSVKENYMTDQNGFYRIKFAKRYNSTRPVYEASQIYVLFNSTHFNIGDFDKEFLQKQKGTFKIDTLWLEN